MLLQRRAKAQQEIKNGLVEGLLLFSIQMFTFKDFSRYIIKNYHRAGFYQFNHRSYTPKTCREYQPQRTHYDIYRGNKRDLDREALQRAHEWFRESHYQKMIDLIETLINNLVAIDSND